MNDSVLATLQLQKGISIKEAMKQLGKSSWKTLFLVDRNKRLLGSLTDGDIRRWILRDGKLDENVEKICNKSPEYVEEGKYKIETVKRIMVNRKMESVPVVDDSKVIRDVLFWENIFGEEYKKTKKELNVPVVIMAGGQGKRMSLFAKIWPKPLIPVGEKPVIELVMDSFYEKGCDKFTLLLNHRAEMIRSYFDNTRHNYHIQYVQESTPLGTAGGLKLIYKDLPDTFFLSNCDTIIKGDYEEMLNFHKQHKNNITIIASYKHFSFPYGVIKKRYGKLKKIIEKPEYDHLVVTGLYVMQKKAIELIPKNNKEFHMPDLIEAMISSEKKVGIYPVNEKAWTDIGEMEKYKEAIRNMEL